jgi:hypothetical protein
MGDRIRPLVKRDPAITANVLRLWLQEHRSAAEASFSEQKP